MRTAAGRRCRGALLALVISVAALGGGALLGACTSGRSVLGTSSSGCYAALPSAVDAVRDAGRLKGVLLVSVGSLRSGAPLLYRAARSAPGPRVDRVCLVAFTGRFSSRRVAKPVGRPGGTLAVVELAYPGHRVLATLIVPRAPLPFGHSHIRIF
jgi:hypothetical protein